MARLAASVARFSPTATPDPMMAGPTSFITVRRSAKSALISPGTLMRSVIPFTACRRTLSAIDSISESRLFFCIKESRRSLGTVMMVSAYFCISFQPFSALRIRYLPSKLNGLVTTATVKAPSSLLSLATMGAAPVPVPPPRPAVTKTISVPFRIFFNSSTDSRAAWAPISGSAPAPRPFVIPGPSCRQISAFDCSRACLSVFATINSTPRSPLATMVLIALPPPPPIPMTLTFATPSDSAILNGI